MTFGLFELNITVIRARISGKLADTLAVLMCNCPETFRQLPSRLNVSAADSDSVLKRPSSVPPLQAVDRPVSESEPWLC